MTTKRIFISYKRVNKGLVDSFLQQLSPEIQDDCWMDLTDINYTTDFESKICKAIDQADAFLFMYSKEHTYLDEDEFAKDWTIRELNYAEDRKKKIWLISIDNSDLTGRLKFRYSSINVVYNAAADIRKLNVEILNWLWQQRTNTRHLIEAYQSLHRGLMEIANQVTALSMEEQTTRKCPICDTEQEAPFRQSCSKCRYAFPPLYGIWPDLQLTRAEEQEIRQFRELWIMANKQPGDNRNASLDITNEGIDDQDAKAAKIESINYAEKNSSSDIPLVPTQIASESLPETKEDKGPDEDAGKVADPGDDAGNVQEPAKAPEAIEEESRNTAPVAEEVPENKLEDEKTDEAQEEKPTPTLDFEATFGELNTLLAPPAETTEVEQPAEEVPPTTEEAPAEEAKEETPALDLTKCNDDLTSMFNLK